MNQSIQSIIGFRVRNFAMNIYLYGNTTLMAIPTDYYIPVEQYAAGVYIQGEGFTPQQIATALNNGWITQQQYDETMAYMQ